MYCYMNSNSNEIINNLYNPIVGVASLEVGKRNNNLHIQGVFDCRYPAKEEKTLGS